MGVNGINQGAYVNSIASAEYQNGRSYAAKDEKVKKQQTAAEEKLNNVSGRTIGSPKLSDKALKYYEQLKKKYSNMEFVLISPDKKAEVERNKGMYASSKELLVLIDSDKIERMAEDEEYRKNDQEEVAVHHILGDGEVLGRQSDGLGVGPVVQHLLDIDGSILVPLVVNGIDLQAGLFLLLVVVGSGLG